MGEFRKLKSLKFLYEVNEDGVVRNVKSKKIVKGYIEKNGYLRMKFENKCLDKVIRKSAHQLVAEAFIPNPDNLPEVNHKDSNRLNNNVSNLEWCSHSDNMKHAYHIGEYREQCKSGLRHHSEMTRKAVTNGERVFESISDAGEFLVKEGKAKNKESGIAGVSAAVNNRTKTVGGYEWKFI